MEEDERDLLEVLIFDEIEETVGTWLRTIIQRLEREQTAIRRKHPKQPTSNRETPTAMPHYQKHPEVRKALASDCVGPTATGSSDFGPTQFWPARVKVALLALVPRVLLAQSSRPRPPASCTGYSNVQE